MEGFHDIFQEYWSAFVRRQVSEDEIIWKIVVFASFEQPDRHIHHVHGTLTLTLALCIKYKRISINNKYHYALGNNENAFSYCHDTFNVSTGERL